MKRAFYIVIGCLALSLGAVGSVLPVLPTTPFLLLAAFCFAKSSQRLRDWFIGTALYRRHLKSFVKGRGMTVSTKIRVIVTITIVMGLGIVLMHNAPVGQILLSLVWLAHFIYFVFVVKNRPKTDDSLD